MSQQPDNTGIHPTTIEDVNHQQVSHNKYGGAVWMKKPETVTNDKETMSAISSTRSEYGSSDGNSSTHSQRPVADKDAFIQSGDTRQHWQYNMTPAERAKQLAAEMNETHRRSSAEEKKLKIGGQKELKLN
jgi:hypothetical protein